VDQAGGRLAAPLHLPLAMKLMTDRFYAFLARPLFGWSRWVLAALTVPLALSFTVPLWRISMNAVQYPEGLTLDIYPHRIEGGNNGQHLQEINTLNHYIGMQKLDEAAMQDLDWIPFALGALFIFALRVAAIGNVSALVDLVVMTTYVSGFAFARFLYMLYNFGHNLSPQAPVKVPPFMPAIIGSKQIANFTTHSFPQWGSACLGTFAVGVTVLLLWHLFVGRREAVKAEKATSAGPALAH
jgi:copper chaperone NosL